MMIKEAIEVSCIIIEIEDVKNFISGKIFIEITPSKK